MATAAVVVLALLTATATANNYDVLAPELAPPAACALGCARWSDLAASSNTYDQAAADGEWADPAALLAAGSSCAMPANATGGPQLRALRYDFSLGPTCFCAGTQSAPTSARGACLDAPDAAPYGVNVAFGGAAGSFVVAFTTEDAGAALVRAPVVELCGPGLPSACVNASGATARYAEPQLTSRVHSGHTVPLPALVPGARYAYRVRGGTAGGAWAPAGAARLAFDAPPAAPARFTVVGDAGVYAYNMFSNLVADHAAGASDYFVHLGDHAYNLAMADGARGDAYMRGLQPVLSQQPWLSVVGNHEHEGSPFGAYCARALRCDSKYLNLTSALLPAAAASGSPTQRYYSLNVGLVHWVFLDYNQYIGVGPYDNAPMLAWLAADLAAAAAPAARAIVPWIFVAGHVPMYSTGDVAATEAEVAAARGGEPPAPPSHPPRRDDGSLSGLQSDIEPLLLANHVDLHIVGHEHLYESSWPLANGAPTATNLVNPAAPIHVTTGAGGAPAFDSFVSRKAWTREQIVAWSYSRVSVHDGASFTFEQVDNGSGKVLDSWTVTGATHGAA